MTATTTRKWLFPDDYLPLRQCDVCGALCARAALRMTQTVCCTCYDESEGGIRCLRGHGDAPLGTTRLSPDVEETR